MKKLKDREFYTIFNFYNFKRASVTRNGKKIYGTYFWLTTKLTDEIKTELLAKYNNVILAISQCQYAPEIKSNVLFIADKAL